MSDLDCFEYSLPPHLIAQHPLRRRSDARLMVVERDESAITHRHVRDLPELLSARDVLVVNNTRVVPARIVGHRVATGGRWEGLFLSAHARGTTGGCCAKRVAN